MLKKNQKVYLTRMDRSATYDVVEGKVARVEADTVFVRIATDHDGRADSVVIDYKPGEFFAREADALMDAIRRCHQVAAKYLQRQCDLAARLAKLK